MKSILDIQIQKLFLVTLILKVTSSFLGWYFQLQWSLGFAVPLLVMVVYIVLGYYRRDTDVTDEKFADSCYYLGFIFTITSIIFSLFDLPNIGTKIQEIAVRFGAAMVSTVLGLGVRVYLVSFKKDVADALKDAEDAVLDVTRKLTEQLKIALDRLRDFESQVDTAAKSSVERVNMQVENLSKNHADKLNGFFNDLTSRNQEVFTSALNEVKTASQRLSDSVDGYSQGMRANLTSIETKVGAFTDAVTHRLETTTFPDDYFAKHLGTPLTQLKDSASVLAAGVKTVSDEVKESSALLSKALKKLREQASATENSLDTVLKLTVQQQAVLDSAQGQLTTLGQLTNTLANFDTALTGTIAGIAASNVITSDLTARVFSVVTEGAEARKSLEESLAVVIGKLNSSSAASNTVAEKLDANTFATISASVTFSANLEASTAATNSVIARLDASNAVSELIANKLDGVAAADVQAAATLGALGQHATIAFGKVDQAVEHLQGMVRQLSALDTALRNQSAELKQVAERIEDVRVVVEMPPSTPSPAMAVPPIILHQPIATTSTVPAASTVTHRSVNDANMQQPNAGIDHFAKSMTPLNAESPPPVSGV